MNKRTYELIGKWIADHHKLSIVFDNTTVPYVEMNTRTIHFPLQIQERNAISALATCMHEAGHLRWSEEVSQNVGRMLQDDKEKDILNCMEDARIDCLNFDILPNIIGFYRKMVQDGQKRYPPENEIDVRFRVLVNLVLQHEGFSGYGFIGQDVMKMLTSDLQNAFYLGISYLNQRRWTDAYDMVVKVKNILYPPEPTPPPQPPQPPEGEGHEEGQESNQGKEEKNNGNSNNTPDNPTPAETGEVADEAGSTSAGTENKQEEKTKPTGGKSPIEDLLHPPAIWQQGELPGSSTADMGEVALEEQTIKTFKELLNITENKRIDNGSILDTDNLITYFTGQIDELFKDEIELKKKKSKLLFLLDASGSMEEPLLDGQTREIVLIKCVKSLQNVLEEIKEVEGINISYEIHFFDNNLYTPTKLDDWESEYHQYAGGGTNFEYAFRQIVKKMQDDYETDGKRMIIVCTDGCVGPGEIAKVKETAQMNINDMRIMFVGIGTDPTSAMATEITNGRMILGEEQADAVILETVTDML